MSSQFMSGFGAFGKAMPKVGITKFTAKKGDTRIRILSIGEQDFLMAKTHYLKGVGSFHCFSGSCCSVCANAPEGESNSQERAILPIAIQSVNVAGGSSLDFAYLALPATKYEQLVSLNTNVGDVSSYDILIQCTDEQYQKYTFLPLINQPSMVMGQEMLVGNFLNRYRAEIMKTLGKTMDETSFQLARAKALQTAAQGVGVQFTPNPQASQVFSQPASIPTLPTNIATTQQTVVEEPKTVTPPVVEVQATTTVVEDAKIVNPPVVEVQATTTVVEEPKTVTPTVETQATEDVDWSAFMA